MKHATFAFAVAMLPAALHAAPTELATVPQAVHDLWVKAEFRFTPEVEETFLNSAKASALKKLAAVNKTLPADFLTWVDSDSVVKTTVYGARQDAVGILLMLRSLEIDLGHEVVRKKYTQLALAMAVVYAKDGDKADLSPRAPLILRIGGDPRKRVDTHDKNRPLDLNDHIINFLNDHAPIEKEVVVGHEEALPALVYDSTGKAIPQTKAKPLRVPITEKRLRPLRAADVIADAVLEKEFNEYMKAHGQTVQIHCGKEKRLNWKSTDAKGIDGPGTKAAFELFKSAYKSKGYLPPERDPVPTPAQSMAFLIRNNETAIVAEKKIAWPRFPISAPWPVLTFLANDRHPLREREDIWQRYRDKGKFHGYGEYVGPIAQTPVFLNARRLSPFAFSYGSVQMMLKDGGVCGAMANIAVRSHQSLGTPASTAAQPGHCALVRFAHNVESQTYRCVGDQYATAGDAGTRVHVPWFFGDVDGHRPMVYHQSVAWSVNHGLQSYLDSIAAHTFFKQLSFADHKAHGAELLQSALALCPYNFLLVEDLLKTAQPAELVAFWNFLKPMLTTGKPGCPAEGLYNRTIKESLFSRLTTLPVPADTAHAEVILAFLLEEKCDKQSALANYKVAVRGVPAILAETETTFKRHLVSARNRAACTVMADALNAAAGKIVDKKQRALWALARWQEAQGQELYMGRKNIFTTDASLNALAKHAGQKPRSEADQVQSLLSRLAVQFKSELPTRTPAKCKQFSGVIAAAASQVNVAEQKLRWLKALSQIIAGNENFRTSNGKAQRDPCADVIVKLLQPAAPVTPKS